MIDVMITRDMVIPLFIEILPECIPGLEEHWKLFGKDLLCNDLGIVADCMVEMMQKGDTSSFLAIFSVIERISLEGDDYVQNAIVVGLLENIQNVAGHREIDLQLFKPFLLKDTAYWWNELNEFWTGGKIIGQNHERPE